MSNYSTKYGNNLLALLAGCLLPLAFAPFGIYPLAILCPALLLWTWLHSSPRQTFYRGFIFGLGLFGIGASWIFVSIHEFGNTNFLIAGFITALFVSTLALFPAFQGYLLRRFFPAIPAKKQQEWLPILLQRESRAFACTKGGEYRSPPLESPIGKVSARSAGFFPENTSFMLCLAFPASWVLFEWIRSWFFTGFPWLFLGASQTNSPLRGLAPVIGEYGLSFIVAFCAGLLILIFQLLRYNNKQRAIFPAIGIILIFLISTSIMNVNWTQTEGKPVTVSLVQGNIPQQIKWDPDYLKMTLDRYAQLSENHWQSQLVIWPEAAIPLLLQDAKEFLNILDQKAKQNHAAFITGIPIKDGFYYYNGVIALGSGQGVYYKRHLVPFGEYVPLEYWLRGLIGFFDIPMSNFSAGIATQDNLEAAGMSIAPFVCYEIAYPSLVFSGLPQANLLLTVSNDAWFGHSFAAAQHLQIAQLRALETGRYHLFSNNTGVSAIISPQGTISAATPAFQATVLTGTVMKMNGVTPIVWLGVTPILIAISLLLAIAGYLQWRRITSSEKHVQCAQDSNSCGYHTSHVKS